MSNNIEFLVHLLVLAGTLSLCLGGRNLIEDRLLGIRSYSGKED